MFRHKAITGWLMAMVLGLAPMASSADADSHRAAVLELMELTGVPERVPQVSAQVIALQLQNVPLLDQFRPVVEAWMRRYFSWEAVGSRYVDLYVSLFTEQEIQDMLAFYRTSTGRKAVQLMPVLMAKGGEIALEQFRAHQADLQAMIQSQLELLGPTGTAPGTLEPK
jgi:hypothetical protein